MYHASTVCQCNVRVACYDECFGVVFQEGEQGFITHVFQFFPFHGFQNFVVAFAQDSIQQSFCHDGNIVLIFNSCVSFVCVYSQSYVGRQCPRCCCPSQEVFVVFAFYFEFCDNRCFFNIFIALSYFVRGKGSTAARAVGNNFVTFIKEAFVPDLFQCPPFGFDIFVMVSNIRMIHVSPETNTVTHGTPFFFVSPNAFFTFCDEGFYAVIFNLRFAVQTQRFFNFQFNRQAVSIPTSFSQNFVAFHCFVTRDQVFDRSCDDVADMRFAVCCRGAIIESKYRSTFSCFDALAEDVMFFPELFCLNFSFHKVQIGRHFVVHINSSFGFVLSSV